MSDETKRSFNEAANGTQVRDKDNANPKLEPKLAKKEPAPNLAPMGSIGIRRGLRTPQKQQATKRFSLSKPSNMKQEFKFAARNAPDKDRSRGR